jgi:putative transcription factor
MICELCGTEVSRTKNVAIESSVLAVCNDCARFGQEISTPVVRRGSLPPVIAQRLEARQRRQTPRDVYANPAVQELAEDFPMRIREARETRGWKQADLGAKINEKASVIAKLESGAMTPGDSLVKKLERELGIKLMEKLEPVVVKKAQAGGGITLGDLVKLRDDDK